MTSGQRANARLPIVERPARLICAGRGRIQYDPFEAHRADRLVREDEDLMPVDFVPAGPIHVGHPTLHLNAGQIVREHTLLRSINAQPRVCDHSA